MSNQIARHDHRPSVTIITPVLNEEHALDSFVREVSERLLSSNEFDFTVLFVDDGSTDGSWQKICGIAAIDSRFHGIRLSRNFGSHTALSAGIANADSDAIATMACDLQDPPGTILLFGELWQAGAAVVWGKRRSRSDERWRRMTSTCFAWLMRRFAMPIGSKFCTGSFFLLDRKVVESFRAFRETNRITFALVAWSGFEQAVVEYDRRRRVAGKSRWTLARMIHTFYDAFIGFSTLPIRLFTIIGSTTFSISMILAGYVLTSWVNGTQVAGWASIVLPMALFFGVQFLLLGLIGEYLHRIYVEVVQRPLYFIANRTEDSRLP